MSRRHTSVRAPSAASLSDSLRVPSNTPSLLKSFTRLSRTALADLVLVWLDPKTTGIAPPFLAGASVSTTAGNLNAEDEISQYPPARSVDALREVYLDLRARKGGRRELVDRILDGDWRHGVSLKQLAMVDMYFVDEHPANAHRWTALRVERVCNPRLASSDGQNTHGDDSDENNDGDNIFGDKSRNSREVVIPRLHPATFIYAIQREVSPLVKAHYYVHRSSSLPLTFVRIFFLESPYQTPRQDSYVYTDTSHLILLAFPDSAPFLYTTSLTHRPSSSTSSGTRATATATLPCDPRTLRALVHDAIPFAISNSSARYALSPTSLSAKSLHALLALRGAGRGTEANGAFSAFAAAVIEGGPLDPRFKEMSMQSAEKGATVGEQAANDSVSNREMNVKEIIEARRMAEEEQASKKRKLDAQTRFGVFGDSSIPQTANGIKQDESGNTEASPALDRLEIHMRDPANVFDVDTDVDDDASSRPSIVSLTFSGTNVISGLRKLAECGIVDPARIPAWMTGEEGVSVAGVHHGKTFQI